MEKHSTGTIFIHTHIDMYIFKHTKICYLCTSTQWKKKGTDDTWKEHPLPSQYAHKFYVLATIATMLQFLIHYSQNAHLSFFSHDFIFKFPSIFVNAPLWAMSYITFFNCIPCVQYCSQREKTEIPKAASFYTCSEGQWLFQNLDKITIPNRRTQTLNSIHLSQGLMHMCFKSCPI